MPMDHFWNFNTITVTINFVADDINCLMVKVMWVKSQSYRDAYTVMLLSRNSYVVL